jgi:hypothetical protein
MALGKERWGKMMMVRAIFYRLSRGSRKILLGPALRAAAPAGLRAALEVVDHGVNLVF